MENLTNCRYRNGKLYLKLYGQDYQCIDYSKKFFVSSGFLTSTKKFRVYKTNKCEYFTKTPVDLVEVLDYRYEDAFKRLPVNIKYLYDLPPEYYFILYDGCKFSDKFKVSYLDIETNDDINSELAESEIYLISILTDGKMKTFSLIDYPSETKMLIDFYKYITEEIFPDIVFGWNVVDFDYKYIINRSIRLDIRLPEKIVNRFILIDFINMTDVLLKMFGYKIIKRTKGLSLDAVCTHFLGKGKTKIEVSPGRLYRENISKAIEYNQNDVYLLEELDNKLRLFEFMYNLHKISNVFLRDIFYNSYIIDMMILRKFKDKYVFPTKQQKVEAYEEYEGGYVITPPAGIFSNVCSYDFSGMYPTIILTFNIAPDSKAVSNADFYIDGVGFKRKPDGIFKTVIKELLETRLKLKMQLKTIKDEGERRRIDVLQTAYKVILNSVYGACAYRGFRFFDVELAKSITGVGRKLMKVLRSGLESNGYGRVLYGDTDSIYVQLDKYDKDELKNKMDEILERYLDKFKIDKNERYLNLEFQEEFTKMLFFGKKKKYIGRTKSGDLYIKGFETEKYDTPVIIRKMMIEILHLIFDDKEIDILDYYEELKSIKSPLSDFVIYKRLNKKETDYKVIPSHLKALKWAKENLSIDGEVIKRMIPLYYVYVDGIPRLIYYDKSIFPDNIQLDYDRYFFFFLIKKMLDVYFIYGIDKIRNLREYIYYKADDKMKRLSESKIDEKKKLIYLVNRIWSKLNAEIKF